MWERRGTGQGRGVFIGGGVLGGGGEGIRDPEKIGIPAAAARLGVGRKKTAGEGDRAVGPSGQWHKGERERSGRRGWLGRGSSGWLAGLACS